MNERSSAKSRRRDTGVEADGRLVEEEELGVAREGEDERQLDARAEGEGRHLLVPAEAELAHEALAAPIVPIRVEAGRNRSPRRPCPRRGSRDRD
jgi:hypothetical protein